MAGLEAEGFKVRTRALTTTLFARLFLADLFIHGIGGGKYDELTDAIVRRFYGFEPPRYLVLSATRWLPLPSFPVTSDDRWQTGPQATRPALESAAAPLGCRHVSEVERPEMGVDRQ